jgi:hypothetical protein
MHRRHGDLHLSTPGPRTAAHERNRARSQNKPSHQPRTRAFEEWGLPRVALTGLKLNLSVLAYLQRWQSQKRQNRLYHTDPETIGRSKPYRLWRLQDRLSPEDIQTIIDDYVAGTTQSVLATRYAIGLTSLKQLLRQHGISRKHS